MCWGPGEHDGAIRLVLSYKVYGVAALWAGTALAALAVGEAAPPAANGMGKVAWRGI